MYVCTILIFLIINYVVIEWIIYMKLRYGINLTLSTLHKQCMVTIAAAELIFGSLIPYTVVLSRPQYDYFWR